MKHAFGALCAVVGLSAFLNAQTQDPPMKPADPAGAESAKAVTVTGCLQESGAGQFTLAEEAGAGTPAKTYRLSPSSGIDLKTEVGHRVEVTGTKAGKEPTARVIEHPDPNMLKVTAVKQIATTCGAK